MIKDIKIDLSSCEEIEDKAFKKTEITKVDLPICKKVGKKLFL